MLLIWTNELVIQLRTIENHLRIGPRTNLQAQIRMSFSNERSLVITLWELLRIHKIKEIPIQQMRLLNLEANYMGPPKINPYKIWAISICQESQGIKGERLSDKKVEQTILMMQEKIVDLAKCTTEMRWCIVVLMVASRDMIHTTISVALEHQWYRTQQRALINHEIWMMEVKQIHKATAHQASTTRHLIWPRSLPARTITSRMPKCKIN